MVTRDEIKNALQKWNRCWNNHDLEGVMDLFHDDVFFQHWTGSVVDGKEALRQAWAPWFKNHGGFRFIDEDTFIDETDQKALFQWQLDWPSQAKGHEGKPEKRRGVDILHFQDGKIIKKLTYSKTALEIRGRTLRLSLQD